MCVCVCARVCEETEREREGERECCENVRRRRCDSGPRYEETIIRIRGQRTLLAQPLQLREPVRDEQANRTGSLRNWNPSRRQTRLWTWKEALRLCFPGQRPVLTITWKVKRYIVVLWMCFIRTSPEQGLPNTSCKGPGNEWFGVVGSIAILCNSIFQLCHGSRRSKIIKQRTRLCSNKTPFIKSSGKPGLDQEPKFANPYTTWHHAGQIWGHRLWQTAQLIPDRSISETLYLKTIAPTKSRKR